MLSRFLMLKKFVQMCINFLYNENNRNKDFLDKKKSKKIMNIVKMCKLRSTTTFLKIIEETKSHKRAHS